jgi:NAD+ synthase
MHSQLPFSSDDLNICCESEIENSTRQLQKKIVEKFRKRGFVLGLSGGIDSSVVAAICVRAAGKERVLGLLMPEKESSPDTLVLSNLIADSLEIQTLHIDITSILEAVGCYQVRDNAIRELIPEYSAEYKCKIVLPSVLENEAYRLYSIVVESPDGKQQTKRLSKQGYLDILSASNFKQRVRKMLEYFHADRLNYAVAGTPNRQEYDQGFFVKSGDGSADTKPIAHLYKTQVYQLAEYLGVPKEIRERAPTTDTYPMPQSQEEFFFSLPYEKMDLCLYGKNQSIPLNQVAAATDLTIDQVERVFRDIDSKRKSTQYLHSPAVLVEEIPELPFRPVEKG